MNFTVEGQINVGMGTNSVPSPELKKIFSELRTIDFTSYRFIKDSKSQPIGIELNVHNPALYHELVETKKESGMLIDIVNGKIVISAVKIDETESENKSDVQVDESQSENKSENKSDVQVDEAQSENGSDVQVGENKVAEIKPLQPELNDGLTEEEKSSAKIVDIINNKPFKLDDGIYKFNFKISLKYVLVMHVNGTRTYIKNDGEIAKLEKITKISPVKK